MAEYYQIASESPQYPAMRPMTSDPAMRPMMSESSRPAQMQMLPPTQMTSVKPRALQFSSGGVSFDGQEILKKAFKYLLEGVIVALVAAYLSKGQNFELQKVVVIGVTAAVVFALLDQVAPSVAMGARTGAGFAIGHGAYGVSLPISSGVLPNTFS
jgi:hypothetical protein